MNMRPYRMTARAAAAEQTGDRIMDAMLDLFARLPYDQVRVDEVAADARVTAQTVVRRFGSKAGLLLAVVERELVRIVAAREQAAADRPRDTIDALVTHYERYGALILKMYAEARLVEGLPEIAAAGRVHHLDWCERAFADHLDARGGAATRARRLARLTVACDATTWHILHVDRGLAPDQVRLAIIEMIEPLLKPSAR